MARVRDTTAMIGAMNPVLQDGIWHFCTCRPDQASALLPQALASMQEPEGLSLILPQERAAMAGLISPNPMVMITLQVNSALDGVGLTAAVATALTGAKIPCNVVAANHHDHVFVPEGQGDAAVGILNDLAAQARG